ncbi:transcription antitermination factor NusB [Spirochaeta lutea]|uniref:Transcription antitermination protein NusB n=1 Tax=Spirochaeta lutea TaxID=1480694 RepID=A0A098R226_9SPIO|nr:transcription antitermination factor NusB [Spirochaeta lutea]KGE73718.1 antitermination protein NusB [Spirochaeta lutea]
MISRRKSRILAFQTLYEWEITRTSLDELLKFSWIEQREKYSDSDLFFPRLLVQGVLENMNAIDALISGQLDNWPFSRVNKVDLSILRLGVYELTFNQETPVSVAIDEAVEIAREYGVEESYRFVNGVLDGIAKKKKL